MFVSLSAWAAQAVSPRMYELQVSFEFAHVKLLSKTVWVSAQS